MAHNRIDGITIFTRQDGTRDICTLRQDGTIRQYVGASEHSYTRMRDAIDNLYMRDGSTVRYSNDRLLSQKLGRVNTTTYAIDYT